MPAHEVVLSAAQPGSLTETAVVVDEVEAVTAGIEDESPSVAAVVDNTDTDLKTPTASELSLIHI